MGQRQLVQSTSCLENLEQRDSLVHLEFRIYPKLQGTHAKREFPVAWGIQHQNGFPGSNTSAMRELLGESNIRTDSLARILPQCASCLGNPTSERIPCQWYPLNPCPPHPTLSHDRGEGDVRNNLFLSDLHLPLDDGGGWVGVILGSTAQPSHLFSATPTPGRGDFASWYVRWIIKRIRNSKQLALA